MSEPTAEELVDGVIGETVLIFGAPRPKRFLKNRRQLIEYIDALRAQLAEKEAT